VPNYPKNQDPTFCHFVQDDSGNHYGFVTNFETNNLVRLDFGQSLQNTPVVVTIPIDVISRWMEGIQIIKDEGQWWGFIIGGNPWDNDIFFLRLNFGSSLFNIPTAEHLGVIGGIAHPHELFFFKENETWIGLTINKINNTISRFIFGDNLSYTPVAENLGEIEGLDAPSGFFPIQIEGDWHLFVANENGNSLSRLNFGESLLNDPAGIDLGSFGILGQPRDVLIHQICDNYIGLILNRANNELILLDFGNDILSTPSSISLGNFGDFSFPHSFSNLQFTEGGIQLFVTNIESGEVIRLFFEAPANLNTECQEFLSDFEIKYETPSKPILQIVANPGLPNQDVYCKQIVVQPSPNFSLGNDTIVCDGESLVLDSEYDNTIWQNEFQGNSFEVFETSQYVAQISEQGCTHRDSIFVSFENCEECILFPNIFTPNGDNANDVFRPVMDCNIEPLSFHLEIYNRWGQHIFSSADTMSGWDGYFEKELSPAEVYAWKSTYTYYQGSKMVTKCLRGNVTLIR